MHTVLPMSKKTSQRRPESVSVPVRLSTELDAKIDQASRSTNLSKQDVMRLSLERGLKVLVSQLAAA